MEAINEPKNDIGNILSKTGLGAYTYGSAHPHAVTGVENTGYVIQSAAQHIDYNPWGKASRIEEGQYSQTLRYGPDRQRWKLVDSVGVQRTSLIYPHANYEWRYENGVTRQFHYLENGILVLKENNNDFWYFRILTDNVGSVVRVIDGEGTAVVEMSYDAWGKPTVALNQMAFPRGFGGHEMLTKYRLVNMDGRLYDSVIIMLLSITQSKGQELDNLSSLVNFYKNADKDCYLLIWRCGRAAGRRICDNA